MHIETLIVGGGLAGLRLTDLLTSQGHDVLLIEARDRLGGRVKTIQHNGSYFDLGPTWYWSEHKRMAALISALGLESFEQYATGDQAYEDEKGQVHHATGFASMAGSWRVVGGMGALIDALAARIPAQSIRLGTALRALDGQGDVLRAQLSDESEISARRIIFAQPPRLVADLSFTPSLPDEMHAKLQAVPTWMAGQAKAVAVYETPFWRSAGLSGDAMSQRGPCAEIHDATPKDPAYGALFGFIGVPPSARTDQAQLRAEIISQFVGLFGEKAATPLDVWIEDWASQPGTANALDAAPLYAHPTYQPGPGFTAPWCDRLFFAGTEVAPDFGGYLEGALEGAERCFASLTARG